MIQRIYSFFLTLFARVQMVRNSCKLQNIKFPNFQNIKAHWIFYVQDEIQALCLKLQTNYRIKINFDLPFYSGSSQPTTRPTWRKGRWWKCNLQGAGIIPFTKPTKAAGGKVSVSPPGGCSFSGGTRVSKALERRRWGVKMEVKYGDITKNFKDHNNFRSKTSGFYIYRWYRVSFRGF